MRLHDIISSSLLPRFAEDAEWEQNALDVFVKAVRALSFGLGAPYTRKAISALTDADLQAYFLAYGIVAYYPELSRQTRENMLFELARMYRFLGTPYAITALCRYIFDESDAVEVEVKDNLAFDDDGELIDASLLDLFDIAIDAQSASIGGSAGDRIVANVLKIARNSQALRNIYFRYEDEIQIPVRCADYIGFAYRIGDDYELSRPTGSADQTLELLLGFRNTGSGWESVKVTTTRWAGILSQNDHYEAEKFGLQVHSSSSYAGPIGSIVIDYTFGVELLGVYTDASGSNPVDKGDGWEFVAIDAQSTQLVYMGIKNILGFATSVMSYKARFTKRDSVELTVYFTSSDGGISGWVNGNLKNIYYGGEYVLFDNGKTYELVGVYNGETQRSGPFYIGTTSNSTNPYGTRIQIKNGSGSSVTATRAVIRVTNRQTDEREAWLNADKTDYTLIHNSTRELYNEYSNAFVENMERKFEIVRLENSNGDAVQFDPRYLPFSTGSYGRFRIKNESDGIIAAKIVYRSIPWTHRAWLRTNHNGKSIDASTYHYIYDEDGHRVLYHASSTYSVLALYDSSGQQITFTFISLQKYTSDGVDYTVLANTGSASYEDVTYIIYKES